MDHYVPAKPTLQDELTLLSPPTPGERGVLEALMGLAVGFTIWMALGAPGFGEPPEWVEEGIGGSE